MKTKLLLIAVFTLVTECYGDFNSIQSWPTLEALPLKNYAQQSQAITNLACRLLPDHCKQMTIEVDETTGGKDQFTVSGGGDQPLNISASSGVAAAVALHRYLREVCNASISWDGDQLNLPAKLPQASFSGSSPHRYRYYQNVCTFGYTFVWWDWSRWERELDWMALNGINLALAYVGQEAVWKRVFQNLGLTKSDINHHFSGPAFLPWNRMGNMRGWGGPLSDEWHRSTIVLQRRILGRMRELGILPILPGFSGIVPKAFKRIFPDADTVPLQKWNNFPEEFCCPLFLQPTDPLFQKVGTQYLKELIGMFGTDHLYGADPFNEMRPDHSGAEYLTNVSNAIYRSMQSVDPQAIWVLQGWMFAHDSSYWNQNHIKAFLTAVPTGRILVLDLQAELTPMYNQTNSFHGQPFVWCMLHNFGGTLGLYGAASITNEGLFEVNKFPNNSMVGIGITPEGTGQNYVMYDLMLQLGWETQPFDLTKWFTQYHTRRYGLYDEHADKAWQLLKSSVFNSTDNKYHSHGYYVIALLPELAMNEPMWYNADDVFAAWEQMLQVTNQLSNSTLFIHDLVDVTRQSLQLIGAGLHKTLVQNYIAKNSTALGESTQKMLKALTDLDKILSAGKNFLLGTWLEAAKSQGTTELEKQVYEFNARNQITLWGPKGEIRDYANKQWAGVVSHYFLPRWTVFTTELTNSLLKNASYSQTAVNRKIFEQVEEPFTLDRSVFPTQPSGDAIAISKDLFCFWKSANSPVCKGLKKERLICKVE